MTDLHAMMISIEFWIATSCLNSSNDCCSASDNSGDNKHREFYTCAQSVYLPIPWVKREWHNCGVLLSNLHHTLTDHDKEHYQFTCLC